MCGAIATICKTESCEKYTRYDLLCYECKKGDEKDDYTR